MVKSKKFIETIAATKVAGRKIICKKDMVLLESASSRFESLSRREILPLIWYGQWILSTADSKLTKSRASLVLDCKY